MESLTLQQGGSIIGSGDAVGQIQFAAPSESDAGASRYIVGQIYAQAEGAFNSVSNPASLVFSTSAADNLPASGKLKVSHEGHFLPLQDNTYDLGAPDLRFRHLYAADAVISPTGELSYLYFDTTVGDVDQVAGQLNWNSEAGTIDLGLTDDLTIHLGQSVLFRVKNSTGSTITKGEAVYASGVLGGGQVIQVAPFAADESVDEVRFIGLMTDDLANGEDGFVNHFGHIKNVDLRTSNTVLNPNGETWNIGDILFVDDTSPGGLTKVQPKDDIYVALVLADGQNGELFVRITDPGHINDLHDVDTSGIADNNFLVWNSGLDIWEPSSNLYYVNGDIGIGTASPSAKLNIYDNNSAGFNDTSFRIQNPASSSNTYFDIAIGTSTGYNDNVWFKRNGVNVAGIYNNNNWYHYESVMIRTDRQIRAESNGNAYIELLDGTNDTKIGYLSDLRFYSSGAEKMVLDVNGNLGIGTNSPQQKLHIDNGNVRVENTTPVIEFHDTAAVGADISFVNDGLVLSHSDVTGDNQLVIASNSGVGVGTDAPTATLHAYSPVPSSTVFNVEGTNGSLFSVVDNLSGVLMSVNNNAGLPVFEVYDDDSIIAGRFAQNDFVVSSGGDVGIGTGSPSYKLDVVGTGNFTGDIRSSGNIIMSPGTYIDWGSSLTKITDDASNGRTAIKARNSIVDILNSAGSYWGTLRTETISGGSGATNYLKIKSTSGAGTTDYISLGVGNNGATEAIRVINNGNVGINNSSPSYTLDVAGTANITGNVIVGGNVTVNGTTVSANVDTMEVADPILTLGLSSGNIVTNTNLDRGMALALNNGVMGFMGWDTSENEFSLLSSGVASNGSGNYAPGTYGDLHAGRLILQGDSTNTTWTDLSPTLAIKNANSSPYITFHGNDGSRIGILQFDNDSPSTLGVVNSQPLRIRTNNQDRIYIEGGGNVGIATSSPSYKLDVNGTAGFSSTINAPNIGAGEDDSVVILDSDGKLRTDEIDSRVWGSTLADMDDIAYVSGLAVGASGVNGTGSSGQVAFWTDTNDISGESNLYWDQSNDRLGVGTATPSETLHVVGTARVDNLKLDGNTLSATNTNGDIRIIPNGTGGFGAGINSSLGGNFAAIGGGCNNNASGNYATIGGGYGHAAVGNRSTISGGYCNRADGYLGTVGGGCCNSAYSNCSTISGGYKNFGCGSSSTVAGGEFNCAGGDYSTVGGGYRNCASGSCSTISGGYCNTVAPFSPFGTIGGGSSNCVSSFYATVSGGRCNNAICCYTTVGGGRCNTASSHYDTVSGGCCNTSSGGCSTVSGGRCNSASGYISTVGGGVCNIANGSRSTISGGSSNNVYCCYGFIGGGTLNVASGDYSAVVAGSGNIASGACSFIGGGFNNSATNNRSVVSGGSNNIASAIASTISGGLSNFSSGTGSVVAGGSSNCANNSYSTVSGGVSNCAAGVCSTVSGGQSNSATGNWGVIGGGWSNNNFGGCSVIAGGRSNSIVANLSFIGAGYNNASNGGSYNVIGGGSSNSAPSSYNFIGGGRSNSINGVNNNRNYNSISGGYLNCVDIGTYNSIHGGYCNCIGGYTSSIIGGSLNTIQNSIAYAIAGGLRNNVYCDYGIALGGTLNVASGDYSAVVGGSGNIATGDYSFIAGGNNNNDGGYANVHILGSGITATQADTTYTQNIIADGHLAATTKSFLINHPTRPGHKLQYGSLESPYHGVRLTGRDKITSGWCVVKLPEYIRELVHDNEDVNIQLTNYRHGKTLYVSEVNVAHNEFTVKTDSWFGNDLEFFWSFTATRKDIDPLRVEY